MLMITLAISYLTTSNLPWFMWAAIYGVVQSQTRLKWLSSSSSMDLTFQVSMQFCSLQHWTLLPSPVTFTTGCCCLLWLCLFILSGVSSPSISVAYWAPTDLGSSSFSVLSFHLFRLFRGFSRQEYWSTLPFPSPVDHVLSELSTITHLSWVALHSMAHTFIELDKAAVHIIRLVSFLWLWFLSYR